MAYSGLNAARGAAVTLVAVGVAVIVVIGGLGAYYLYTVGNTNSGNPSGTSSSVSTTTDEYGATYTVVADGSYPLTKSIDFEFSVPSSISGVGIPSAHLVGNFTTSGTSAVYAYVLTPQQFMSWQSGQSFKPVWEQCCVFSPSVGSIDTPLPNGTYHLVFDLATSESAHLMTDVRLYLTTSYFQLLQQKPFGDYASVVSTTFNGTELELSIKWLSSNFLPIYYQASSPATAVIAETRLCSFELESATSGQTIGLAFDLSRGSAELFNANLLIAVKQVGTSNEFYVAYSAGNMVASNAAIPPTAYHCQE